MGIQTCVHAGSQSDGRQNSQTTPPNEECDPFLDLAEEFLVVSCIELEK